MKKIELDPRCKLLVFLVACTVAVNTPNSIFIFGIVSFLMLLLYLSGEFKCCKTKYIILTCSLALEFILSFLPATAATMFFVTVIVLIRLFFPILISFQLIYKTTTISQFMAAFTKMKLPATFIIPFAVMFRFIPTVQEEWNGIQHAMGFRGIGLRFKNIVHHPLQTVEFVLVPLLFSCVNVMDELVAASLARGLDSEKKRTCIAVVNLTGTDYLVILISVIFLAIGFII